jgi:hypothetical protein
MEGRLTLFRGPSSREERSFGILEVVFKKGIDIIPVNLIEEKLS